MTEHAVDLRACLELHKLAVGAYAPLEGFMGKADVDSVADTGRLPDGRLFPLPVVLGLPDAGGAEPGGVIELSCGGGVVGRVEVEDRFELDLAQTARAVFGTDDARHPGVRAWLGQSPTFVSGRVSLAAGSSRRVAGRPHVDEGSPAAGELSSAAGPDFAGEPLPADLRALFAERGWRTVVAFNTRNIPHRAHEYLHRLGLETADGLLIHPIVGPRKQGDYTREALMTAYRAYIERYLPADRVVLAPLAIPMRYAGPREAVLHALIRRNYGCTHLIVGRDHAGVGDWYGKYEAQRAAVAAGPELGIEILAVGGPFFCEICDEIVSDRTCPHPRTAPDAVHEVSGSLVRQALRSSGSADPRYIRPEVVASLSGLDPFLGADG